MPVSVKDFGTKDGRPIRLFTLQTDDGCEACVSTLGATLTRWTTADRDGKQASIVLGYTEPEPYLTGALPYFNSIVGRYANRIDGGRFVLDGTTYQLSQNEGENHLHGGFNGLDKQVWDADADDDTVELRYTSPAGAEGYPGTVQFTVRYRLTEPGALAVGFEATTDVPTIVNLAMHGWFNLSGVPGSTVLDHELRIAASRYTPVRPDLIPTGELAPVEATPFDFRGYRPLGEAVDGMPGGGYDHNFVLDPNEGHAVLSLYHPESGRHLNIYTDQPGLQVYTAQGFNGSLHAEGGAPFPKYGALVLEPQHFPDSPNQPQFPSVVLRPGETYRHVVHYACWTEG